MKFLTWQEAATQGSSTLGLHVLFQAQVDTTLPLSTLNISGIQRHFHYNSTHLPIFVTTNVLEAAVRAAGVGDAGLVADVPIPLPGAALRTLGRRVGAVNS